MLILVVDKVYNQGSTWNHILWTQTPTFLFIVYKRFFKILVTFLRFCLQRFYIYGAHRPEI